MVTYAGASALLIGGVLATATAIARPASSQPGTYTTKGAWKFNSAPKLHPPILHVKTHHSGLASGYFLVANLPNGVIAGPMTGEGGPILYDSSLRPVWVRGVGTKVGAANLERETYQPTGSQSQPLLAWWQGNVATTGAVSKGEWFFVDEHYHQVATLKARSPWVLSLHDAIIQGPNVWVTAYRHVTGSKYKSWKGTIYDAGIQEYDLKTGKLLYQWDALKGPGQTIPLSASEQPTPHSGGLWDAYHLNSVQPLPSGNILFSLRNTWSVYLLDPKTNKILWTLGGKNSSFKSIAKSAHFAWQHDAQLISGTGTGTSDKLSVFNDDCTYLSRISCQGPSEGMVLTLNTKAGKATLVKAYQHKPSFKAQFLGSMQVLPNGNALVGWGSPYSYFTEFSKTGSVLLDVQWPGKDQSYRAKFAPASGSGAWVGTPYYPPSGSAKTSGGKSTVYASWNGATQVAGWNVLAGSSASSLKKVASHGRSGFETAITLKKSYSDYQVQAVDSAGHVLGTSKTFT